MQLSRALERKPSQRELEQLEKSLPSSWTVTTAEKSYTISTMTLRRDLAAHSAEKADVWVRHLAEIEGSDVRSSASATEAHAELTRILASAEFGRTRPPSLLDRLRSRMVVWLDGLLSKLFMNMARHPMGAEILFWLLLVGAVAAIALVLYRLFTGNDRVDSLQATGAVVPLRSWQEWLRAARQAADANDFREAVHSVYWAAISRLQERGIVPRDRAKTPREYLRLVVEPSTGGAPAAELHSTLELRLPLQALTSRFERVWYANVAADLPDFEESLRQLEELGCPLD